MKNGIQSLFKDIRGDKRFSEPLSRYCSFRIGGEAELLILPEDVNDLIALKELCVRKGIPLTFFGFGTNILFRDGGVRGVVVTIRRGFGGVKVNRNNILAGAGVGLLSLVNTAAEYSLKGLEFAAGIPGSLGGAVIMNAGTDTGEIKDVLDYVRVLNFFGDIKKIKNEDIGFGYRKSGLPEGSIVLDGKLILTKGERKNIENSIRKALEKRRTKQPDSSYNAGSVFKNPPGNFAGRLIEDAGMKGYRIGGVAVSEFHANFIINDGNGSASDVLVLIEKIRQRVYKNSGLLLEEEIRIIGED